MRKRNERAEVVVRLRRQGRRLVGRLGGAQVEVVSVGRGTRLLLRPAPSASATSAR